MTAEASRYYRSIESLVAFNPGEVRWVDVLKGSHLSCVLVTFEPEQIHEPHTHRSTDQIFVVMSGRGTFTIGGEARKLVAGDAALAPAGTHHGVVADGGERLVVLAVTAPPPIAKQPLGREPAEIRMPDPVNPAVVGSEGDIPGAAISCKILEAKGDRIVLEIPGADEPLEVVPTPTRADRLPPGPVRVIIETSTLSLKRTMGTARAVKTREGEPHRFTGVVVSMDAELHRVVVDAGFPVVVRDLSGKAGSSLAPGSGVTFETEGPTRAVLLT